MSTTTAEETNLSGSSAPNVTRPGNLFPDKLDRFLDVVAYNPGGEYIFVGTSSLSTTIWKGSAWLFSDSYLGSASCLKPAPADCLSGIVVETGVSAAVFVDQSKLLFGCDSGALRFNDVRDSQGGGDALKVQLTLLGYSSEHSCTVSDLDVLDLGTTAVSCSQDCSIKVWDVASLVSEHTFSPAHVNPVTGVRRQPNSSHTFASTSLDGTALFWDIRQSKPATSLYAPGVGLTAVTWSSAEKAVLGSVSGEVVSVDIRKASEPGGSFKAVHRPVHRLQACPDDPSLIAVCQDSSTFTVIKCEDTVIRSVYQDDRHGDFVRCATWHPTNKALLTCSWDSTISSHPISGLQLNGFGKQDKSS